MPRYPQLETVRGRPGRRPGEYGPRRGLTHVAIFALAFVLTVVVSLVIAPRLKEGSQPATVHRASHRTAATPDQRLALVLAPILRRHRGNLAVGVIDSASQATAAFDATQPFHAGAIVTADVLAALLLQDQSQGMNPGAGERRLATRMIENSDIAATTDLWQAIGGGPGLAAANVRLGLRHTTPGAHGYWGLTSTTVADQLTLLSDLTAAHCSKRRTR